MKNLNKIILSICALLLLATTSNAQTTAYTDPVGGIQRTIYGTGTGTGFSFFAPTLRKAPDFAGAISTVSATTITVSGTPFTADAFNMMWYVEITSGVGTGIMSDIVDTTTNSVVITDDLTGFVSPLDTFIIRPHITVADVFGTNNEVGLQGAGGGAFGNADQIVVFNNQTKSSSTVWYSTEAGFTGWYDFSFNPSGNVILYPEQGIYIKRLAASDVTLTRAGSVKMGVNNLPVATNLNIIAAPNAAGITLDNSGLYTGDNNTGVEGVSGGASGDADQVQIFAANGSSTTYWYSTETGFVGWYDLSFNPSGGVVIEPETSFIIIRDGSLPAFNWNPIQ